ncbi:MAG: glycosyltransferase family 4 protein [Phycisphaerae bacterium]
MRIAIVIERIEAWRGGAETSTLELAGLLHARGHEIHLITTSRSPSSPNLTVHTIRPGTMLRPLRTAAFVRKTTDFLAGVSFDLVHAVVPLPCADVYQPRGGLLPETLERNVALRTSVSRRLFKRTLGRISVKHQTLLELERSVFRPDGPCVLAVSQYVARQCERYYGITEPRVRVVFNGVRTPTETDEQVAADRRKIRRQYHVADDTLLLLFVAHNLRLKGMGTLIDALVRLRRGGDDFKLLVVGRDNPVRFVRRIERAGLSRHIVFTGPTQRAGAFYHAADVCIHPTFYDPCSRVVLEALSRGVPCITTAYNGATEVMTDGVEGFVVDDPGDGKALAVRIGALRSDTLRRTMSKHAIRLRERISMARHVRELEAAFTEIVAQRRRSKSA